MNRMHVQGKDVDLAILLTASIDPRRAMLSVGRSSVGSRLSDYGAALKRWLGNPAVTRVIFCDNSGYDLSAIRNIGDKYNPFRKTVELLSFNANSYPGAWGKGYGELQIIAHALAHSRLIGPETRIVKVTGRYYVRNVGPIIKEISTSAKVDVFCDLRSNLTWGESRIFCASANFLNKFLLPMLPIVNESEGILFEHALGRAVHRCMADGGRWSLLPEAPIIVGVDGTTCIPLANSFLDIFRRRVFVRLKQMTLARS